MTKRQILYDSTYILVLAFQAKAQVALNSQSASVRGALCAESLLSLSSLALKIEILSSPLQRCCKINEIMP